MLTTEEIRDHCFLFTSFGRGTDIFQNHNERIHDISTANRENGDRMISAQIEGSGNACYDVALLLSTGKRTGEERIKDFACTCQSFLNFGGMCKHCVALALAYRDMQEVERLRMLSARRQAGMRRETSAGLAGMLARCGAPSVNAQSGISRGEVRLSPALSRSAGMRGWELSCQIGVKRLYIVKNLAALVHNVLTGGYFAYGKQLAFAHAPEMFDEKSRALFSVLESEIRRICPAIDTNGYESASGFQRIALTAPAVVRLLELYSGGTVCVGGVEYPVVSEDPPVTLALRPVGADGAQVHVPALQELVSPYFRMNGTIYRVSEGFCADVLPFLRAVGAVDARGQEAVQYLAEGDYRGFCGNLLPLLTPYCKLESQIDLTEYQPQEPEFAFYLAMTPDGALSLRPVVQYGAANYPLFQAAEGAYRREEREKPVREAVLRYFSRQDGTEALTCAGDDAIFSFLETGAEALRTYGELFVDASAKRARIAAAPRVRARVRMQSGLIDLNVSVEDMPRAQMRQLLTAYAEKKRYFRLPSGAFLSLEDDGLAVLTELAESGTLSPEEPEHAQLPAFRAQYLNGVLTGQGGAEVERSMDFKALVRRVRDYRDADYPTPAALQATLRAYQKTGFRWLCALAECGLGGILADDMGLGKTVQAIAFLLHRKQTALIVCPASLVYNWGAELEKFAPSLRVQLLLGAAQTRQEQLQSEADVFVTSYDLLRRDVEHYAGRSFGCCILDEAQYVRNAETKLAHAVKQITAEVRFALTGTPVYNRLADLWSIFDFILPGYLETYAKFRKRFEIPVTDGDTGAAKRLTRMTSPFILRRKKEDVLRELPEKVESIQYVELTAEQALLYRAQEQQLRESLKNKNEADFQKERVQFLAALTRLRQLCCTPELYLEGYTGGAGKVDACMELLAEATEGGHRTLVFSQFTTMLRSLLAEAERHGLRCLLLTGADSKERRREMVAQFQSGGADVFFISLKAGGTGLNLTAADRIIHFDPWWNAAAEEQATDRAHRIGQDRTVFVTKLVAKGTVEERIAALQAQKRALSDTVMESGTLDGTIGREALLALLGAR